MSQYPLRASSVPSVPSTRARIGALPRPDRVSQSCGTRPVTPVTASRPDCSSCTWGWASAGGKDGVRDGGKPAGVFVLRFVHGGCARHRPR